MERLFCRVSGPKPFRKRTSSDFVLILVDSICPGGSPQAPQDSLEVICQTSLVHLAQAYVSLGDVLERRVRESTSPGDLLGVASVLQSRRETAQVFYVEPLSPKKGGRR